MDRSSIRSFVTLMDTALLHLRRSSPRFSGQGTFRRTSAQRRLTGFVLLAFAVTQIFYPMDLLAAGRLSPKNTPPDSFLRTQVDSVPDLVNEIQHNLKVRRNYARHFGLPSNQIAGYIRRNLVIRTLHRPYRHVVYCVRPDGVFFYVRQTMPVGTKVFALKQSGRPVLKWACGNPFTKRLPHPDTLVTFLRRSKPHVRPTEVTASDVEVVTPNEAAAAVVPIEAVAPSTEVIGAIPLSPASFIVPAALIHGGGGSLLPFLPLIPILFGAGGGGGGGSNGGGTTGGSTATTGGSTATTGGSTATTGGSTATTGGSTATTGGSTATTGGSTATTGGSTATTGGSTATTGGSTATTGGSTATTGGSTATTGGSTATTGGSTATTGGTTASVVPEPGGSSTIGYAFLVLALLAFASSIRRRRQTRK